MWERRVLVLFGSFSPLLGLVRPYGPFWVAARRTCWPLRPETLKERNVRWNGSDSSNARIMIWLTKEAFGYAYEFVSFQVVLSLYSILIDDHLKFSQKTFVMSPKRCIFAAEFKNKTRTARRAMKAGNLGKNVIFYTFSTLFWRIRRPKLLIYTLIRVLIDSRSGY